MSVAPETPVRDAATIVLARVDDGLARVLMGQRGTGAAFMPDKFVFPGGAVDPEDAALARDLQVAAPDAGRLAAACDPEIARALPLTAIRELWEETGLRIGRPGIPPPVAPRSWEGFFAGGLQPGPGDLRFVFRAVTPPGRPRRFDARFFLAAATAVHGDPDDFAAAGDELRHLQWLDLAAARALPLPFITEIVLSEIEALLAAPDAVRPVPFFRHEADGSHCRLL